MQVERINVGIELHKAQGKKNCSNCGTKFEFKEIELQNYIDGNIVWKKEQLAYCRNCNELFFRSDYDDFVYKHPGYFDYKLVQHIKEKKGINEENKEIKRKQTSKIEDKDKTKNEIILPKADFFVRTSISNCSKKNHKIIDFLAEVDVICSNGNVIKKTFPASYCEECKLYFMYDEQYKKLRKSGVPLCSIYEYSKYIKTNNNGRIELKPESLLHSFGYNVGASEGLSAKQRKRILTFVINNGIMSKHEIINLLSYFVDFRKNDKRQTNAITKWKIDIDYLRNTDIDTNKKVEVNSIRVINTINKHK